MSNVYIVGKQSFVSKKGTQCNILHVLQTQNNVEGMAVNTFFVSDDIFRKVLVKNSYDVVYGAYNNGRAFVADLVPVPSVSHE